MSLSHVTSGGKISLELKENQYILSLNGQEFASTYDVLYALELYRKITN